MTHSSFLAEAGSGRSDSVKSDVFKVNRHAFDASNRRCDPVGELARLDHPAHQRLNKRMIVGVGIQSCTRLFQADSVITSPDGLMWCPAKLPMRR